MREKLIDVVHLISAREDNVLRAGQLYVYSLLHTNSVLTLMIALTSLTAPIHPIFKLCYVLWLDFNIYKYR